LLPARSSFVPLLAEQR